MAAAAILDFQISKYDTFGCAMMCVVELCAKCV